MADDPTIEEVNEAEAAVVEWLAALDAADMVPVEAEIFGGHLRTLLASHASLEERASRMEAEVAIVRDLPLPAETDETVGDVNYALDSLRWLQSRALAAFVNEKET